MKFYCNPTELSEALNVVSRALVSKAAIPILEGIKILAEGTEVTLTATDTEFFIERKIQAEIKLEGEAVVIGKFFTEFIRKLTSVEAVEIEKISSMLFIRYLDSETEIQCLNEDAFPITGSVDDDFSFFIKEKDLKDILEKTLFCIAQDDTRPILKGCLLEAEGDALTTVALDGYRLAVSRAEIKEKNNDVKIIVPGKILTEVQRILEDSETDIKINIQKNNVLFNLGHTTVISRLLEGEFIQYTKIIPSSYHTLLTVKKEALQECLDRASLMVRNKKNNYLKFTINNNQIVINTNSELGSIREVVACTHEGKGLEIAFNSKFVLEALSKIKDEFVKIEMSSSNAPAVVTPVEGDKFKFIILPVRLV
jgi:DNA polymerase-3 subunit beta